MAELPAACDPPEVSRAAQQDGTEKKYECEAYFIFFY